MEMENHRFTLTEKIALAIRYAFSELRGIRLHSMRCIVVFSFALYKVYCSTVIRTQRILSDIDNGPRRTDRVRRRRRDEECCIA